MIIIGMLDYETRHLPMHNEIEAILHMEAINLFIGVVKCHPIMWVLLYKDSIQIYSLLTFTMIDPVIGCQRCKHVNLFYLGFLT
jgi:hypothetical protein